MKEEAEDSDLETMSSTDPFDDDDDSETDDFEMKSNVPQKRASVKKPVNLQRRRVTTRVPRKKGKHSKRKKQHFSERDIETYVFFFRNVIVF